MNFTRKNLEDKYYVQLGKYNQQLIRKKQNLRLKTIH